MEKVYIFGASKLGEFVYRLYESTYQVVGFIDNDLNKQGQSFCKLEVFPPSVLIQNEIEVIIASAYWKEIESQLINMNFMNYQIFKHEINLPSLRTSKLIKNDLKSISAGALINSLGTELVIEDLTFLNGGSSAMDYLFLKAVAIKQQARSYLEIGTWTGESLACIAEVVERCYSISLPDNNIDLINVFDSYCNKENFSRYFSSSFENVINFEEDSQCFDYSKIKENIDLVFIDGDHSYKGIKKDTENIFERFGYTDTIIIWHDFKTLRNELVVTTYEAIKNNINEGYLENLFAVQGTYCGIYIPTKYRELFQLEEDRRSLYSYSVKVNSKLNKLK